MASQKIALNACHTMPNAMYPVQWHSTCEVGWYWSELQSLGSWFRVHGLGIKDLGFGVCWSDLHSLGSWL
jgi:hypothetical protein